MGHSVSTDRDRHSDLAQFTQATATVDEKQINKSTKNNNSNSSNSNNDSSTIGKLLRRQQLQSSTLFSLPVDTFVHITRFLPIYEVVHHLTLVHPLLYDIMYDPYNVDIMWNGRKLQQEQQERQLLSQLSWTTTTTNKNSYNDNDKLLSTMFDQNSFSVVDTIVMPRHLQPKFTQLNLITSSSYNPTTTVASQSWMNDYMMCVDSDSIRSIVQFLSKSQLSHFRIHFRTWNEDWFHQLMHTVHEHVIEMHMTAFENRTSIHALKESICNGATYQFKRLETFSAQNSYLRSFVMARAPLLSQYVEYRVHTEQQFNTQALLVHPHGREQMKRLVIKGTCNESSHIMDCAFLSHLFISWNGLTSVDLKFTIISEELVKSIFMYLKQLKSLSLGHCTLNNRNNVVPRWTYDQVMQLEDAGNSDNDDNGDHKDDSGDKEPLLRHLTHLHLSFLSDISLVGCLLHLTRQTLKYFTIRKCTFPREASLPHLTRSMGALVSLSSISALQPIQIRSLLKMSSHLKQLRLRDASEQAYHDIMSIIPASVQYLEYRPSREQLVLDAPLRYVAPKTRALRVIPASVNGAFRLQKTTPVDQDNAHATEEVLLCQNFSIGANSIHFGRLESLVVEDVVKLAALRGLATNCKHLKHLKIDCLDGTTFERLVTFENLESLHIGNTIKCTNYHKALIAIAGPKCHSFHCPTIVDDLKSVEPAAFKTLGDLVDLLPNSSPEIAHYFRSLVNGEDLPPACRSIM